MFQLADGRQNVYQWDINVKLLLDESNESADEVHFSARFSRVSLSVEVVHTEDSSYVTIPNILLQKPNDIIAYSYITNADGSYTKYDTIIPVIARPKPSGYVYEETEILTWKTLDNKIDDLGKSTADSVKYTEQELTDEQKAQARTNIGAVSVGEVPEQVQADYSQNDRTQPDFIKNRTHYQDTFNDSGYPVEFMDGTHNVGDIVLLRAVSKNILKWFYISGINAPYTETLALYLKFKVTYSGGTYTTDRECKDTVASNGSPIVEIIEFSTGNIKALYYNMQQPYIAWYFISDLTTLPDAVKAHFPKTGIYAQVVNDLQSASSIQIGYHIEQYVKLDSKYISIPTATNDAPGVVKPVSKTDEMTQPVGVDENGALFTVPPGGSSVSVDDTLTISGAAADAKATGDQIRALSKSIATKAEKAGWNPDKYIGTDAEGNLVEKDAPASGTVGYPVVSMTASSAELTPNTYYRWGEIAALTVTLAEPTNTDRTNEYCFEFVSGETPTTLSVPDTVKWVKPPVIEAGKTYQVSILNGIGVICGA